jgi:non-specific serine/threonine protein kinase
VALRLAGAMGWFWYVRGDRTEGRAWLGHVLAVAEGTAPAAPERVKALNAAGLLAHFEMDHAAARSLLAASLQLARSLQDTARLALARQIGNTTATAHTLEILGVVARFQEDYSAAAALVGEALALRQELDDRAGIAFCLEELACLASLPDRPERARRLAGAATALRTASDRWRRPADQADLDRCLRRARQALSAAAQEALAAQGQAWRLDEAITYALEPVAAVAPDAKPVAQPALEAGLSDREAAVLRLVAAGKSNRAIAKALCLSEKTVANHLTAIFTKTGVDNRAGAAAFAIRTAIA